MEQRRRTLSILMVLLPETPRNKNPEEQPPQVSEAKEIELQWCRGTAASQVWGLLRAPGNEP